MYVQRRFPFKRVIIWTKRELIFFIVFATVLTALYQLLDIKWLQVPFTPVALIGTAVAFMVGFQNNAAYDRIWVFNTMLRIGLAGENQFEGSPNDVPISNISRGITRDILQIIDEDPKNIPPPFDNVNHVQM